MNRQANVREFKRLESEIAKSEADVEAKRWRQAELAAGAVADGITRAQYGEAVGKTGPTIGRFVRIWERWGRARAHARPRFADAMATIEQGSDEIITRAEQTRLQKERQVPTQPRDRIEMAATLLKDPQVMKAAIKQATTEQAAARVFSTIVYDHNADRRKQERERVLQKARDGALPLPAYMVRMVAKMNEWTGALAGITNDEIEELPEGSARDSVGLAVLALAEQADRWVAILRRRPALQVIEGRARRS